MTRSKKSDDERLKESIELKCKKCGSMNVVFNYEREGAYSECTTWGSNVTFGCNDCHENDVYIS